VRAFSCPSESSGPCGLSTLCCAANGDGDVAHGAPGPVLLGGGNLELEGGKEDKTQASGRGGKPEREGRSGGGGRKRERAAQK
jgi:hypothetical protein